MFSNKSCIQNASSKGHGGQGALRCCTLQQPSDAQPLSQQQVASIGPLQESQLGWSPSLMSPVPPQFSPASAGCPNKLIWSHSMLSFRIPSQYHSQRSLAAGYMRHHGPYADRTHEIFWRKLPHLLLPSIPLAMLIQSLQHSCGSFYLSTPTIFAFPSQTPNAVCHSTGARRASY